MTAIGQPHAKRRAVDSSDRGAGAGSAAATTAVAIAGLAAGEPADVSVGSRWAIKVRVTAGSKWMLALRRAADTFNLSHLDQCRSVTFCEALRRVNRGPSHQAKEILALRKCSRELYASITDRRCDLVITYQLRALELAPLAAVALGRTSSDVKTIQEAVALQRSLEDPDDQDQTPLIRAVLKADGQRVELLLGLGVDPSGRASRSLNSTTPLHLVSKLPPKQCQPIMAQLLQAGADVNIVDSHRMTPLMMAADRTVTACRQLLDAGAETEPRSRDRETALILAAFNKKPDIVQLLLERQAAVNAADCRGNTALYYAVQKKSLPMARALCQAGADATIQNFVDRSALGEARCTGSRAMVNCLLGKK
jgi:hypothetical protein